MKEYPSGRGCSATKGVHPVSLVHDPVEGGVNSGNETDDSFLGGELEDLALVADDPCLAERFGGKSVLQHGVFITRERLEVIKNLLIAHSVFVSLLGHRALQIVVRFLAVK